METGAHMPNGLVYGGIFYISRDITGNASIKDVGRWFRARSDGSRRVDEFPYERTYNFKWHGQVLIVRCNEILIAFRECRSLLSRRGNEEMRKYIDALMKMRSGELWLDVINLPKC